MVTHLRDYLRATDIHLALQGTTKSAVMMELVTSLGLGSESSSIIYRVLERREMLGSTGVGHGLAIPHCRTHLVPRLRVVFGRKSSGVAWEAVDAMPVTRIFLLVAPPIEVANDYLPVLGRIARLMSQSGVPERLDSAATAEDVLSLLDESGV